MATTPYHSLNFHYQDGSHSVNTWNDWRLIPATRPVVAQPAASYKYVDIPGMDGSLDLSTYLVGRPTYSDRSGSFTFYVANEDPVTGAKYGDWALRKQQIAQYLDGSVILKMSLEDDPHYYYIGRFYMKEWSPGQNFSQVTIEYRVKPYKYYDSNNEAVIG